MKVTLNRVNDGFHFEGRGTSGVATHIDINSESGPSQGASPMEFMLMSVGACSAMDVVSILKKQRQLIDSYKMEIEGSRKEVRNAKPFTDIHVKIILNGNIDEGKAIRAAQLSFDKYCSAAITLEKVVKITHSLVLNDKAIQL